MNSDVAEETHLGTYFLLCHRLDASRHFLANLLAISNHVWHLNVADCFLRLTNLSFTSLNKYLILRRVLHLQTLYIINVSSEEEPRHFLLYHFITGYEFLLSIKFMFNFEKTSLAFLGRSSRHFTNSLSAQNWIICLPYSQYLIYFYNTQ